MRVADIGGGHGAKFKVEALLSEHDVSPSIRMHRQIKGAAGVLYPTCGER